MDPRAMGRWTPAVIAGLVLVIVIGASAFASGGGGSSADGTGAVATIAGTVDPATSLTVAQVTAATTPATTVKVALTRTLSKGMSGDDVTRVQTRLKELKFDPGEPDGQFGLLTQQAVWAFQKLVMGVPYQQANGQVTPEMWDLMQSPITIAPRKTQATSTHMEVYLPQQVAVLFKDNVPELVTHISSGSGEEWKEVVTLDPKTPDNPSDKPIEEGLIGNAITPGGVYQFGDRYVQGDGWRNGKLGRMYKPVYFNYGVAVHGSGNVPNHPASHGCVRIPMHIAEYFPDLVKRGDYIYVFDGVKDPDVYGKQPPPFDQRDPDFTTTTEATTTTKAPTTTKPTTTTKAKPVATVPPATQPATPTTATAG